MNCTAIKISLSSVYTSSCLLLVYITARGIQTVYMRFDLLFHFALDYNFLNDLRLLYVNVTLVRPILNAMSTFCCPAIQKKTGKVR